MVLHKKYLFLLVALIAANLIFAHESSDDGDQPPPKSGHGGREGHEGHGGESGQGRTFFSLSRYVRCNYTAQAGSTCANCRQALTCYRSNIGKLRTCKGLFRYCNQGRCSWVGGSACNGTSSG